MVATGKVGLLHERWDGGLAEKFGAVQWLFALLRHILEALGF